jgi:hypothetical protein
LLEQGRITTGARIMPRSQGSGSSMSSEEATQKRRTSAGVSSRRNAHPWLKPALGAWVAFSSARSMMAGSTGRSA